MDAQANAVPFPVSPGGQKSSATSVEQQPVVSRKTVPIGDLRITPPYDPNLPRQCTYPNFNEHLTILQRRQFKLFVKSLKQPIAIVLPTKRNYYDSRLVITNLDQERVLVNLEKHPLAPIDEGDQASSGDAEDQSTAAAGEESYQGSNEGSVSPIDDDDNDDDTEEPPTPPRRSIRIKLISKTKKDAVDDAGSRVAIPQDPLPHGTTLASNTGPPSESAPDTPSSPARLSKRGRGRGRRRGRGRGRGRGGGQKRKMDDDAVYESKDDESSEQDGVRKKRHRTV
ncbi:hypothetical protein GL218_03810 [Daldinia childiae]|uniref:uncharacterized protein n=1 Tax=Daldinia childiae TaxID=326645 RepID=UPI0014450299|nr:uncharacterized protein GL218_03810 [Daldinia childiae]KAF3061899.1 hypothetical protein GL218_03810 [Daldinia childiae]